MTALKDLPQGAPIPLDGRAGVPACLLRLSGTTSLSSGSEHTIGVSGGTAGTWAEVFDTDGLHDLVTNPHRITLNEPGLWLVGAALRWLDNASGTNHRSTMRIFGNEFSELEYDGTGTASGGAGLRSIGPVWTTVRSPTGVSTISMGAFQNSGQAKSLGGGVYSTFLAAVWIAG